jgi:hypothetical protein
VFSNTPTVMHLTTLGFTSLLALGTYLLALQLNAKPVVAIMAYVIFLFQPITVAQSTQVLLEVFLAMHTVYALLFYFKKQYALSAFFTLCAVMTKETGLVLAIAMMVVVFFEFLRDKDLKDFVYKFLVFDIPFLVFAGFLLLQKAAYGWYLNPTNVGKSKLELESMVQKFWDYPIQFSFVDQGRLTFTFVVVAALVAYFRRPNFSFNEYKSSRILLPVFVLGFSVFSVIADAHERYFLSLMPLVSIVFAFSIYGISRHNLKFVPLILILCFDSSILIF